MERPWTRHYDRQVPEPFTFADTTLDRLLARTAAEHQDWVALSHDGADTSYGELAARANRLTHALRALGLRRGDRVALVLPTSPVYPVAAAAAHANGAAIVNFSVMAKGPELGETLRAVRARFLVTLDVFLPNVLPALAGSGVEHIVLHSVQGLEKKLPTPPVPLSHFGDLLRAHPADQPDSAAEPGDVALIQLTSGTGGRPKAAILTHRNLVANLHQVEAFRPGARGENAAVICLLPFFHVFGFAICLQISVLRGYRMVLVPRFDPLALTSLLGLIEKYRPVSLPAVPALWAALVRHLGESPAARALLAGIEMPTSGGAPLAPAVKERYLQLTGRRIHEGYGLSEASSTTHMTPLTKDSPPGSIGIPIPGTDARIAALDDPALTLPPGETGELAVRGPQVMSGYLVAPADPGSAARLVDGWLLTGDLARMDAEGFFFIVDRRDDMIVTSGFNVYPSEIEAALRAHPAVADVAVIGVPDPVRGTVVEARVVAREGVAVTEAELLAHCRARLADPKVPRRVLLVAEIPRTPSGKPLRRLLRGGAPARDGG